MLCPRVEMTGFEPATTRPPDVYSTGLSYISIDTAKICIFRITAKKITEKMTFAPHFIAINL